MDWYYARGGSRFGPLDDEQFRELAASEELEIDDLVWHAGMADWRPAGSVLGLLVPPPLPGVTESPEADDRFGHQDAISEVDENDEAGALDQPRDRIEPPSAAPSNEIGIDRAVQFQCPTCALQLMAKCLAPSSNFLAGGDRYTCPGCGSNARIPDDSRWIEIPAGGSPGVQKCPHCNARVVGDSRTCRSCGRDTLVERAKDNDSTGTNADDDSTIFTGPRPSQDSPVGSVWGNGEGDLYQLRTDGSWHRSSDLFATDQGTDSAALRAKNEVSPHSPVHSASPNPAEVKDNTSVRLPKRIGHNTDPTDRISNVKPPYNEKVLPSNGLPSIPKSVAAIVIILAIVTLPGYYDFFYQVGTGRALRESLASQDLPLGSLSAIEMDIYREGAKVEGRKCALLMTLGQHIPIAVLSLLTVGLLANRECPFRRRRLWIAFAATWGLGMLSLSLGAQYWGPAPQFPNSLAPSLVIYLVGGVAFGMVIGLGRLIQSHRKEVGDETDSVGSETEVGSKAEGEDGTDTLGQFQDPGELSSNLNIEDKPADQEVMSATTNVAAQEEPLAAVQVKGKYLAAILAVTTIVAAAGWYWIGTSSTTAPTRLESVSGNGDRPSTVKTPGQLGAVDDNPYAILDALPDYVPGTETGAPSATTMGGSVQDTTIVLADGSRYEGRLDDNEPTQGTHYHANGDRYEGQFKNWHRQGYGTYHFGDGGRCFAQFVDDEPTQGTFYYANGDRYVGHFKNWQRHGQGTYHFANGLVQRGRWETNQYVEPTSQVLRSGGR